MINIYKLNIYIYMINIYKLNIYIYKSSMFPWSSISICMSSLDIHNM